MAESTPHKIELHFYRTESDNEPVREWLKEQDQADRRVIGLDLQPVQYRRPVGMPLCRSMKGGLWEMRTSLPSARISHVMICFHEGSLCALHGFIKTQATPDADLKLAQKPKKEVENG